MAPNLQLNRNKNHKVGMVVGGGTALILGASSTCSKGLRCSMLLIIPGLFANRGRSVVLTFAAGLLIDGPIRSIYDNLHQVYHTVLCMYNTVKTQACRSKLANRNVVSKVR